MPVAGLWLSASAASGLSRTASLKVNGTSMAHESRKRRSPVSASVNEPRTKRRITNILNGYRRFS
jgi:hypothetical protein